MTAAQLTVATVRSNNKSRKYEELLPGQT